MRVGFYFVSILSICTSSLFGQLVNNGTVLFVDKNAQLTVSGNYVHKDGDVVNNGEIVVKGDWSNKSKNPVFDTKSSGTVIFNSKASSFGGNPTLFPHLIFKGNGIFYAKAQLIARLSLDIDDAEIQAVIPEAITVMNDNPLSLFRNTGFINTSLGSDGSLVRYTKAGEDYVFPLGVSANLLRFVTVKPKDANTIAMSFLDKDPSSGGYSRLSKTNSVGEINDAFYHVINRLKGTGGIDLTFHTSATEKYNNLARWTRNTIWDKATSVPNKSNAAIAPGLTQALYHQNADLALGSSVAFALAQVTNASPLELYNAFSPDGDGKNDTWEVKNIDAFPDNDLKIFDRSGNLVYRMNSYNSSKYWDGQNVASGTYIYILRVKIDGTDQYFKGSITMVKN
ncbi:MAG: gliding motility-associated C-terminal domain-containing protein [Pedobacter sp.]|uniref:gliding motility-associated C-terminal domain-containing protein n=1 Tax=Pedobacter sp. TaxID=1411316 RepID=UPI0028090716|nr:gliding motility-associated C-terminal domain-containing protein [Pedobacter sp.]MDQ8006310.1 gliding motility-associated C-terminal domain-containing protein [Pedobacter sp.]